MELEAGRTYRFDLEGSPTDAGTLSDPYLRSIHDAAGNLIAGTMDNNRGEGRNARKTFTATENGTYCVSAGAWSDRTGTYTLKVTDITARTATSNHLGTYELEAPAPRAEPTAPRAALRGDRLRVRPGGERERQHDAGCARDSIGVGPGGHSGDVQHRGRQRIGPVRD